MIICNNSRSDGKTFPSAAISKSALFVLKTIGHEMESVQKPPLNNDLVCPITERTHDKNDTCGSHVDEYPTLAFAGRDIK